MLPFIALGSALFGSATMIRKGVVAKVAAIDSQIAATSSTREQEHRNNVSNILSAPEIELTFGRQIAGSLLRGNDQLSQRVAKLRRNFARQYGIVIPDIRLSDDLAMPPKRYEIRIYGTTVAHGELRLGEVMVVLGDSVRPDIPGQETHEPAFGMRAMWFPEVFIAELRRQHFAPIDNLSVLLTHVAEVVRGNLPQLLSYKSMRLLVERLEPEYRKLVDEITPTHISQSGLQAVLKLLLSERVSVRNFGLILEAIAEVAPFTRKIETIAEHVRGRMSQQICGDLAQSGILKVVRLGSKWEVAFHQAIKRDPKGEIVEFDIDPQQIEVFGAEASVLIRRLIDDGHQFCIVCAAGSRPYVRMIIERMFPTLAVLSHAEIARGVELQPLGSVS